MAATGSCSVGFRLFFRLACAAHENWDSCSKVKVKADITFGTVNAVIN